MKQKRKPTAYNIFMKETMKKVKAANPGVKQLCNNVIYYAYK